MKNLTPELIAKAGTAANAEELLALAKDNGIELTETEANTYFRQLNASGVVSDDELNDVAGGDDGLSCPNDDADVDAPKSGDRVRFKDGRACEHCGCPTGILEKYFYGARGDNVKCAQCGASIGQVSAGSGKVEKL